MKRICLKIKKKDIMEAFLRRHGITADDFKELAQTSNIDYHNKPTPYVMQPRFAEELIQKIDDYNLKNGTSYGFNISSILSLVQMKKKNKGDQKYKEQFQLERNSVGVEYLKSIFETIESSNPMEKCIMKEVEEVQNHYNSRISDVDNPKLFLMFLPLNGDIDRLQKTMIKFLEKHNLWTSYHVCYSNSKSKTDEDEKAFNDFINKQMKITKIKKKKGCILLLGDQGKIAYTYLLCDCVIRLDNGTDIDDAEQVGYRCLTESKGKTIGIVVDLNIQRVYNVMRNKIKKYKMDNPNSNKTYGDIIQHMYTENQFIFNPNEFDFGNCTDEMIEYYKKYEENLKSETLIETVTCNIQCDDTLCDKIKKINLKDGTYKANPKLNGKQPEATKGDKTKKKGDPIKDDDNTSNSVEPQNEDSEAEIVVFKNINKTKNLYEFLSKLSCLMLRLDYKNPNITCNVIDLLKTLRENEKRFNIIKMKLIDDYDISGNDLNKIYDIYITDMNNQNNIGILDDIFEIYANSDPKVIREIIGKHFIPSLEQKNKNAEIPTPPKLCDEMTDKMPKEYFMNKNNKTLEPCCGKGNFVLAIFERYFDGLINIEDECERCIHIIENCLYFCDIDPMNIYITEELLKCHALSKMKEECWKDWDNVIKICDVKFNSHVGNTLELNIQDKWGIDGYDAVIGNPPYNNELWAKFVDYSIKNMNKGGYLLNIHPCNWRKPKHKVGNIMKKYDIHYIKIYDIKNTFKLFNCNVRVDWYLLQKLSNNMETLIVDDMNTTYYLNIKDKHFIPNNMINIINKVLSKGIHKLNIIRSHKIISNSSKLKEKRSETFEYPVLTNLNSKGKKIKYTDNPIKNVYNKHKVLMSYSLNLYPFYDNELSPTEHTFYQIVNNKEEGDKLVKYLNSKLFKVIIQSSKWIGYQTDHKIFEYIPNIVNEIDNMNDDEIYKYFEITKEEIKLIENTV